MPYNNKNNILFIHIPKTAGTSIFKMLNMPENHGHIIWEKYEKLDKDLFNRSFKFAIVRNPWDKFVSCYEYAKMDKSYWHSSDGNAIDGKHKDYDITNKYNFNDFVKYLSDIKESYLPLKGINWTYQFQYICDSNFEIKMNVVYRFEHLDYMVSDLNKRFNTDFDLPHINKSNNNGYKKYYNDNSIEFINKIYKKDIELFHYKFE
jgi:chondroitin 4-sulfotransferase 11